MRIKKCNIDDYYSIDYLRYQYDYKHYPQFCNFNYNIFDTNSVDFMKFSLEKFWFPCDNEYKINNISTNDRFYMLWKDIWFDYGSCSNFNQYEYFNKSLILYYNFKKYFKKCYYNDYYCEQYFDNNLKIIDDNFNDRLTNNLKKIEIKHNKDLFII